MSKPCAMPGRGGHDRSDQVPRRSAWLVPGFRGHELRKPKGTSNSMIRVPLFDLKFLRRTRGTRCRNFKSAALAAMHALLRHQREHAPAAVVQDFELDR